MYCTWVKNTNYTLLVFFLSMGKTKVFYKNCISRLLNEKYV